MFDLGDMEDRSDLTRRESNSLPRTLEAVPEPDLQQETLPAREENFLFDPIRQIEVLCERVGGGTSAIHVSFGGSEAAVEEALQFMLCYRESAEVQKFVREKIEAYGVEGPLAENECLAYLGLGYFAIQLFTPAAALQIPGHNTGVLFLSDELLTKDAKLYLDSFELDGLLASNSNIDLTISMIVIHEIGHVRCPVLFNDQIEVQFQHEVFADTFAALKMIQFSYNDSSVREYLREHALTRDLDAVHRFSSHGLNGEGVRAVLGLPTETILSMTDQDVVECAFELAKNIVMSVESLEVMERTLFDLKCIAEKLDRDPILNSTLEKEQLEILRNPDVQDAIDRAAIALRERDPAVSTNYRKLLLEWSNC